MVTSAKWRSTGSLEKVAKGTRHQPLNATRDRCLSPAGHVTSVNTANLIAPSDTSTDPKCKSVAQNSATSWSGFVSQPKKARALSTQASQAVSRSLGLPIRAKGSGLSLAVHHREGVLSQRPVSPASPSTHKKQHHSNSMGRPADLLFTQFSHGIPDQTSMTFTSPLDFAPMHARERPAVEATRTHHIVENPKNTFPESPHARVPRPSHPAPPRTRKSVYDHPALQPSADDEWSTFPQRKPRPRDLSNNLITTSAKFRLPTRSVVRSPTTENHEERSGKRPRITLYRPPSRSVAVDLASLENRYALVRGTMRKRRCASGAAWDALGLPSCGAVYVDGSAAVEIGILVWRGMQVKPPISKSLKRSASVASLPTPPRTVRKRSRSRGSAYHSSDDDESHHVLEELGGAPHKRRRIDAVVAELNAEDREDAFWLADAPVEPQPRQAPGLPKSSFWCSEKPALDASARASGLFPVGGLYPRRLFGPPRRGRSQAKTQGQVSTAPRRSPSPAWDDDGEDDDTLGGPPRATLAQEFERIGKAEGKASAGTVAVPKEGTKVAKMKPKSGELLT
ncbi:hypothetical protein BJV77DRAFT_1090252 [Russula vinacea]|nr:hypothetical protein BJV77DRAFT_1090252 [Russula vinacea]